MLSGWNYRIIEIGGRRTASRENYRRSPVNYVQHCAPATTGQINSFLSNVRQPANASIHIPYPLLFPKIWEIHTLQCSTVAYPRNLERQRQNYSFSVLSEESNKQEKLRRVLRASHAICFSSAFVHRIVPAFFRQLCGKQVPIVFFS